MSSSVVESAPNRPAVRAIASYRWTILTMLFVSMTINYIDRQALALLKPTLQSQFHWTDLDYSGMTTAFTFAYGIGAVVAGRVMDYLGSRRGFGLGITVWSLAEAVHGLATSGLGFVAARFALGIGESGAYPAAIKAVAEWFVPRQRALAAGVVNAGTCIGNVVAPLFLPLLVVSFGWRWSFAITGVLGFVWLAVWLAIYRKPPQVDDVSVEIGKIRPSVPWRELVRHRQTWAFAVGKLFSDPIWFLYLFWLPDFFHRTHGLNLSTFGVPLAVIYVTSGFGGVGGGWLSGVMIKRGWSVNVSRKVAMAICAVCVFPTLMAPHVTGLWPVVAILALATAAHQGFSANLFTVASDVFTSRAVGSVVGIGQLTAAVGTVAIQYFTGYHLQTTNSYGMIFLIPSCAYPLALLGIQLLSPRLEAVA